MNYLDLLPEDVTKIINRKVFEKIFIEISYRMNYLDKDMFNLFLLLIFF